MISGGKTKATDLAVGRRILCKENLKKKKSAKSKKSKCTKLLAKAIKAAKKKLPTKKKDYRGTIKQWRETYYTAGLLQARMFCEKKSLIKGLYKYEAQNKKERYKVCVNRVLSGRLKFETIFGEKFKLKQYLIDGAVISFYLL